MPTYYALITTLGAQRLAEAQMSGTPLVFTEFAVGDGLGSEITPSAGMTSLVREVYRGDVNDVQIYPAAPRTIRIEGLIPASQGGFTIREAGFFNGAGELIVVASHPPTYKTTPDDGVIAEQYIRALIEYAGVEAIEVTADPDVVTATRHYVDISTANMLWLWQQFT